MLTLTGCAVWVEPDHFACDDASDCAAGEQCLEDLLDKKACFGPCTRAGDCPISYFCEDSRCVPKNCTNQSDCASGWVCTDSGSCEKPCSLDNQCAPYTCSTVLERCDMYCIVDNDCFQGARCESGNCIN